MLKFVKYETKQFYSRAKVEIVKSNVDVLVKEGLGPRAENDLLQAKETFCALVKLAGTKKIRE